MPLASDYMTMKESAAYMRVTQRTLRRWIASGDLPAFRMAGKTIRIRRGDLEGVGKRIPTVGTH